MKKLNKIMLNLPKNKKYLLACSSGKDSMFLFYLLLKEKYDFVVAHVNYHLREQSDLEQKSLQKFCAQNNIPIFIYENHQSIKNNTEERCREIRYKFFEKIYVEEQCDALLVAHNLEDHLETYLLQKKRKNIVKHYGLSPMTTISNMTVIRPILSYSVDDIVHANMESKVPYFIDHTNNEDIYERNKVRNNIINHLSHEEKMKLLEEINQANILLEKDLKKVDSFNNNCIYANDLSLYNDLQLNMILFGLCQAVSPTYELTHKQSREIIKLLDNCKPNIKMRLKNNLYFIKEYDKGYFALISDGISYEIVIEQPSIIDNEYFYFNGLTDTSNRNITRNDYPLTIRCYRKDDVYQIKDYKVKVNKYLKDMKLPLEKRKIWPIVLNKDNQIIYIPRYRKDFIINKDINFYVK